MSEANIHIKGIIINIGSVPGSGTFKDHLRAPDQGTLILALREKTLRSPNDFRLRRRITKNCRDLSRRPMRAST